MKSYFNKKFEILTHFSSKLKLILFFKFWMKFYYNKKEKNKKKSYILCY